MTWPHLAVVCPESLSVGADQVKDLRKPCWKLSILLPLTCTVSFLGIDVNVFAADGDDFRAGISWPPASHRPRFHLAGTYLNLYLLSNLESSSDSTVSSNPFSEDVNLFVASFTISKTRVRCSGVAIALDDVGPLG